MNFYLLMDDSPSMAIGATQTDINNLISYTASQPASSQNCGFACHETQPNLDSGANSSTVDNLTIARNKGVTLRIDLVVNAVNQLLNSWTNCPQSGVSGGVMQCMSALNNTTYKAGLYSFDTGLNTLQTLTTPTTAGTKVSNIQLMTVDHQNCVVSGSCNTDYGTKKRQREQKSSSGDSSSSEGTSTTTTETTKPSSSDSASKSSSETSKPASSS